MERIIHAAFGGLATVLVLTGTVAAKPSSGNQRVERTIPRLGTTDGSAVVLASKPGSEADRLARQLMAREIDRARADGADPLVLVGMARVNDEDHGGVVAKATQLGRPISKEAMSFAGTDVAAGPAVLISSG